MKTFLPMLAQSSVPGMSDEAKTQMLYVGIFSALILCLIAWAAFIRKSRQKRKRMNRPHHWQIELGAEQPGKKQRRRERRRRAGHSSNLPTNPTLASKGGLPPRRPDDVPPNGD